MKTPVIPNSAHLSKARDLYEDHCIHESEFVRWEHISETTRNQWLLFAKAYCKPDNRDRRP